jgi:putative heme-binding domain-containing protein
VFALCLAALVWGAAGDVSAQEAAPPHWIWHAGATSGPAVTRYFRKSFQVKEPSRLTIEATADDHFTLYLDGKPVAKGTDWHAVQRFETRVGPGSHVLAASVSAKGTAPAGLLVGGGILPLGQGIPIHTNASWRVAETVPAGEGWTAVGLDESKWVHATDLGAVGIAPWGDLLAKEDKASRFQVPKGFKVATVAPPGVTGSVVAFNFDPNGAPCLSIERGPICRLIDDNKDGRFDRRDAIETAVTNSQGFTFIGGSLYAVGAGPEGPGLYRLDDANKDGVYEVCKLIRGTDGGMGEHGPHSVALGPDGRLYYNNGNHAHLKPPIDPASPLNVAYEGELLPHYNDSRGHAAGIMAPGGEIYASSDEGKTWQRVVGGFRNEYDFAFNAEGELFSFDSDMEWDTGVPWYRSVRVNHCPAGAEFGWRNGSGKWPTYYFDSLPGVLDVGRGSPTGVTFYQARQFPAEYRDSFLICDWSQGRILAVHLKKAGASFEATSTELVSGQPLNCTDIEVGPDGAVYFSAGGRSTEGGLFRLSWGDAKPGAAPSDPLTEALEIDSPASSFSRNRVSQIKAKLGDSWAAGLDRVAHTPGKAASRTRALELLSQFGPPPGEELLIALAADPDAIVRARAVGLLGIRTSAPARQALERALEDADPVVRRRACEGLMNQPRETISIGRLGYLLSDPDRFIRFAARVAIEHGETEKYLGDFLGTGHPRPLVEGLLAIVRATKLDEYRQTAILERLHGALAAKAPLDPEVLTDVLRLIELTYLLGPRKADSPASPALASAFLTLFSTTVDSPANRELARLLAYLDVPQAIPLILAHQATVPDHAAQIHDAYCLRAMKAGWNAESKRKLWDWYQKASDWEGGFSFQGYLDLMLQELVAKLDPAERESYLAAGAQTPFPARVLARTLDLDADARWLKPLVVLYTAVPPGSPTGARGELAATIIEKLGRSPRPEARAALRELYHAEKGPRKALVRAIAGRPGDEDLPILVAALGSDDDNTTRSVVRALGQIKANPAGPEALSGLIGLSRRSGPGMAKSLNALASRWTGTPAPDAAKDFAATLATWEEVYKKKFPTAPALPGASLDPAKPTPHTLATLVEKVLQPEMVKSSSSQRGLAVLDKAKCLTCHKFGTKGEGLGPDLTTISSRFQPKDILESMVEPSKVISDQYKAVTVATTDGKVYTGMPVVLDGPNLVLLLSDGTKVTLPKDEIDEKHESKVSVMPAGLIDTLSFQEIADLLALFNSMPRVEAPAANKK